MNAHVAAGADAAFYSSLQSPDEMRAVVARTKAPVKLNAIEGYPTSQLSCDELLALGFKIVGYSGLMQRAAMRAMQHVLEVFAEERTTESTIRTMAMKPADRSNLLRVGEFKDLEQRYTGKSLIR